MKRRLSIFLLTVTICAATSLANESCVKSAKTSSGRAAYLAEDEIDQHSSYAKTESTKSECIQNEVTINAFDNDESDLSNLDSNFENLSSYFDEDSEFSSSTSYTQQTSSQKTVEIDTERTSEMNDFDENTLASMLNGRNLEESSFVEGSERCSSVDEHEGTENIFTRIERLMEDAATSESDESSSSSSEESAEIAYEEDSSFINSLYTEDDILATPMMGPVHPAIRPGINSPYGRPLPKSPPLPTIPRGPTTNRSFMPPYEFGDLPHRPKFPTPSSPKSPVITEYQPLGTLSKTQHVVSSFPSAPESLPQITPSAPLTSSSITEDENLSSEILLSYPQNLPNEMNSLREIETYKEELEEEEDSGVLSNMPLNLPAASETELSQNEKILETESVVSENIPSIVSANTLSEIETYQQQESEMLETESIQEIAPLRSKILQPYIPPLLPTKRLPPTSIPSPIPWNISPNLPTEIEEYQEQESESKSILENIPSPYPSNSVPISNTQTGNEDVSPVLPTPPSLPENIPSPIPSNISPNLHSEIEEYEEQESELVESESIIENVPSPNSPTGIPLSYSQTGNEYVSPLLPTTPSLSEDIPSPIPSNVSGNLHSEIEEYEEQESEALESESIRENIPFPYFAETVGSEYLSSLVPAKPSFAENIPSPIPSNVSPNLHSEIEEYEEQESESESILENIPSSYPSSSVPISNSQTGNEYVSDLISTPPSLPGDIPSPIPSNVFPNLHSAIEEYEEQESESESILENIPSPYPSSSVPISNSETGNEYVSPNLHTEIEEYEEQKSEVVESESILEDVPSSYSPTSIPLSYSHTGNEYVSPLLPTKPAMPFNIPSSIRPTMSAKMPSEIEAYQEHESEVMESESILQNAPSPYSNNTSGLYSQTGNEYKSPLLPTKISSHSSPISNYYSSQNRYPSSTPSRAGAPHIPKSHLPYSASTYSNNLPLHTSPHTLYSPYPRISTPGSRPYLPTPSPFTPTSTYPPNLPNFTQPISPPYIPSHIPNTPFKKYTPPMPYGISNVKPYPGSETSPQIPSQFQSSPLTSPFGPHLTKPLYSQFEKPYLNEKISAYPHAPSPSNFPPKYAFEDVEEIFEEAEQQIYNSYSSYPTNVAEMIDRKVADYLSYHFVIVGSGPAALQAAKIFAEHGKRTLIIEKGLLPPYKSNSMYYRPSLLSSEFVTPYPATIPGTNVEKILYTSNTLGDTVSIGENVWDLGTSQKYREWADLSEKWSWPTLLQYYNVEQVDDELGETFLVDGAVLLSRNFPDSLVTQQMSRAFAELGFDEIVYDYTSPRQGSGSTIVPAICENGATASYTQKIFEHIVNREYVHIALGVELVDINFENGRAVSVVVVTPWNTVVTIDVELELIIGGNIVDTVKWLYQCGVGDKRVLRQLQIPLRQHAPHLGKNVNVSPTFPILCKFPRGTLVNELDSSDYAGLEYVFGQNRIQPALSATYFKVFAQLYDAAEANVQFNFYAFSQSMSVRLYDFVSGALQFTDAMRQFVFEQLADGDVVFILAQLVDATSRGEIKISATEAGIVVPVIDTGMYGSERDLQVMMRAAEMIEELALTETFEVCGGKLLPIPVPQCGHPSTSQTYYECLIRNLSVPNIDITGGGCMGNDRHTSVVNDELKLYGFDNVRLFNAAVVPFGTASGSLAIENIIGNVGAHLVLKDYSK